MSITERKNNHIEINLNADVRSRVSSGFERYRLIHNALPEADFASFTTETEFAGKKIAAPILISSMTGGTEYGEAINRNLIAAAAMLRLPFAVGSQRVYLEDSRIRPFPFREIAPEIPILANVGAVQLNYGFRRADFLRAVEMIGADALILHLNPLQELVQRGGNTDFSGLLPKIASLCHDFPVPVIAKEVGWGISPENARRLTEAGIAWIDVAGAGGTSWSQVESLIDGSASALAVAGAFADWGIPTAECVARIHRQYPDIHIIASGGLTDGVDAAKAVLLGAELCGFAGRLLPAAAGKTAESVAEVLKTIIHQYQIARFLSSGIEKTGGDKDETDNY